MLCQGCSVKKMNTEKIRDVEITVLEEEKIQFQKDKEIAEKRAEKAETELEDFVARICENIFEVEKIGVKESFYNLGGDSVTAMRIAAIIKKEFNVHMTPYDIFEHSTIRELASYIAKLRSDINEKV